MTSTTDVAAAYRTEAARLLNLLTDVPDNAWDQRSPCEEWTVRDVVGHLVDSQRDIVGRVDLVLPPGRDVATEPAAAMSDVVAGMQAILDDPSQAEREYDGAFGRTSLAATIETFHVFDLIVHRWDIATGAGLPADLDAGELDAIEQTLDVVGDNLYAYGACRRLDPPDGANRETRVLARLGRQA